MINMIHTIKRKLENLFAKKNNQMLFLSLGNSNQSNIIIKREIPKIIKFFKKVKDNHYTLHSIQISGRY